MKKLVKSRKGTEDFLSNSVVFIVLVLVFIAIIVFFLLRVSKGVSLVEQVYAKKIALLIDQSKPGTSIELDVMEIYQLADENNFERGNTINIDPDERRVTVKATEGRGYSFNFFNDNAIKWGLEKKSGKLTIGVVERVGEENFEDAEDVV